MPISGYPDLLSYRQRIQTTSAIKTRLDVAAEEAITGVQADITKATRGRVGGAYLMRKAIDDIDQETRINSVTTIRLDLISQGLDGAREAMSGIDIKGLLAIETGQKPSVNAVSNEAESSLRSVMSSLSAKHGSRNLLSGNTTDQETYAGADALLEAVRNIMATAGTPADIETALDTFFNDPAGGFATDIYTGSTEPASPIRIGANEKINVGIKGDNEAIKDALRGLAVVATASSSSNAIGTDEFKEIFQSGLSYTSNGTSKLIALQSEMGVFGASVQNSDARNQAEKLTLTAAYQTITGRDQYEAAAELQQLQVQLESSYLLTSRLSELSLSNYLR